MKTFRCALLSLASLVVGCTTLPASLTGGRTTPASIVGHIVTAADRTGRSSVTCADAAITVNGEPVTIEFDNDCSFVISDVQPAGLVEIRVELADLGVAGTLELQDVQSGELIEIIIDTTSTSLILAVDRRTTPAPSNTLPEIIEDNNVAILLQAGTFDQGLTVHGNKFTLTGQAGDTCADPAGWTLITGDVRVDGNDAIFQNIMFGGSVELRGNKARFINCCFGDSLLVFGSNADANARHGGKHHDGENDDGDDDEDEGNDDNDD